MSPVRCRSSVGTRIVPSTWRTSRRPLSSAAAAASPGPSAIRWTRPSHSRMAGSPPCDGAKREKIEPSPHCSTIVPHRLGALLGAPADRVVVAPDGAGERREQHERADPLRVGGGEQHRHRAALHDRHQVRALRAGRVHHGVDVVDVLLERRRPRRCGRTSRCRAGRRARCAPSRRDARRTARPSGCSHSASTAENVWGTKTSVRSPSPSTWYAIETPSGTRA